MACCSFAVVAKPPSPESAACPLPSVKSHNHFNSLHSSSTSGPLGISLRLDQALTRRRSDAVSRKTKLSATIIIASAKPEPPGIMISGPPSSGKRTQCELITKKLKMVTRTVDLRSETVTKPTEAMRAAMANADVDDDILGSDPTAYHFESEMAKIMGKEAALFVPSGTMGNLISVMVHCEVRGSEVILGDNSHIHLLENGGISIIGGVHPRTVKNNTDGTMDINLIEAAIRNLERQLYYPTTRLICLENTHAEFGGRCISVDYTDRVGELAKRHGLKLHIDGARIFNASVALGVPVHRLVQAADSVSVCMSKGIGAPVGSVIVGSKSFISKAKKVRKTLGGAMRQVGVLCAAACVALKENVGKLEEDHKKAKILAEGLGLIEGLRVDVASVETNIVYIDVLDNSITAVELTNVLEEHGILVMRMGSFRIRAVLHHQISVNDVQYTLRAFSKIFLELKSAEK